MPAWRVAAQLGFAAMRGRAEPGLLEGVGLRPSWSIAHWSSPAREKLVIVATLAAFAAVAAASLLNSPDAPWMVFVPLILLGGLVAAGVVAAAYAGSRTALL